MQPLWKTVKHTSTMQKCESTLHTQEKCKHVHTKTYIQMFSIIHNSHKVERIQMSINW